MIWLATGKVAWMGVTAIKPSGFSCSVLDSPPEASQIGIQELHLEPLIHQPAGKAADSATQIQHSATGWKGSSPVVQVEIAFQHGLGVIWSVGIQEIQPLVLPVPGRYHAHEIVQGRGLGVSGAPPSNPPPGVM